MALYALACPSSGEIRYVGTTKVGIGVRLRGHYTSAASGVRLPVYDWIRKLWGAGLEPEVCDMGPGSGPDEVALIASLRKSGVRLLNCTDGGEGCVNPSTEVREKLSAAARGKTHSPESRAKISAASKGRLLSPDGRAKLSKSMMGRKRSPETCARIGAASRGRKYSQEIRAKMSKSQMGRKHSTETRAKLSELALTRWKRLRSGTRPPVPSG